MPASEWMGKIKNRTREAELGLLPRNRHFTFGMIALVVILALAYWDWRQFVGAGERVAATDRTLTHLDAVLSSIKDAETGQRGYLLTGGELYLATYRQGLDQIPVNLRNLDDLVSQHPEMGARVSELRTLGLKKADELQRAVNLRRAGHTQEALDEVRTDRGKEYMDRIRVICAGLTDELRGQHASRTSEASELTARAMLLSALASCALFLLLLLATVNLNKQKQAAEAANHAKSAFLANMSHELRTPLNAIIGYSEMMMEDAEESGVTGVVPDAEKIRAAGKHLLDLINAVLDLSKIEAGKMELYLETFSIEGLVRETVEIIEPQTVKNGNKLIVDVEPGLSSMRADQTKVKQSLSNLMSNASKFTSNGQINLTVRRMPNDMVAFEVKDTGLGMTEDQITRIFLPFTQADTSTSRKFGGTGLGLVISRRFAQLMGGEITVASVPERGSTFTLLLPQNVAGAPTGEVVTGRSERNDAGVVLAIDDDPAVHELLKRSLSRHGLRVVSARSGEEGMRMARKLRPQVITLDVMMPGMDGWAVLSNLKSDPELANIPVVMLTIADSKNLGYALGAADYLTKPIDRERLAAVLLRYRTDSSGVALVVEDDPGSRDMLRRLLEGDGWAVTEASNGIAGLQQLQEKRPSVILLDLMMPEMDGFEFLDEMHRKPEWKNIPVIVVTAKDLTNEERDRLNGHADKILQKGGYQREELLQRVSEMVSAHMPTIGPRI
jgi:signal transduction histidine kinase/DNA-binding response OmpR family regulator